MKTYQELRRAGVCVVCKCAPAKPAQSMCPFCMAKKRKYLNEKRVQAIKDGICVGCYKVQAHGGNVKCVACKKRHQIAVKKAETKRQLAHALAALNGLRIV